MRIACFGYPTAEMLPYAIMALIGYISGVFSVLIGLHYAKRDEGKNKG